MKVSGIFLNKKNKKAIVWISTVLYILIGLSIMGMLLAVVRPKIAEMKDSFVIDQSITAMNKLDETIIKTKQAIGTRLSYILQLSRGELEINPQEDVIELRIPDSAYKYSEPNVKINIGSIELLTKKAGGVWQVSLKLNYTGTDIIFSGRDEKKIFTATKLPYKFFIENLGNNQIGITQTG